MAQTFPLHEAIRLGQQAVAMDLIEGGISVSEADTSGNTPLMIAALYEQPTLAQWLVCNGAAVQTQNPTGKTALQLATENWNVLTQIYLESPVCNLELLDNLFEIDAQYQEAYEIEIAGNVDGAIEKLKQLLNFTETTFAPDAWEVIPVLAKISQLYQQKTALQEALPYAIRHMELATTYLGEHHPITASTQNTLGFIYYSLGNQTQADRWYGVAINTIVGFLDYENPDPFIIEQVFAIYNNVAIFLQLSEDYDTATSLFQIVLNLIENNFGLYHPMAAQTANNLGIMYLRMGNLALAKYYLEDTIVRLNVAIQENESLVESLDFWTLYLNTAISLTNVLNSLGDIETAKKNLTFATEVTLNTFGEKHYFNQLIQNARGTIALQEKDYETALEAYTQAYNLLIDLFGKEHPDLILELNNLATTELMLKNYDQSKYYYEEALTLLQTLEAYSETGLVLRNIGYLYQEQKNYEEATQYFQWALESFQNRLATADLNFAETYIALGEIAHEQQQKETALQYLEKATEGVNLYIEEMLPFLSQSEQLLFFNQNINFYTNSFLTMFSEGVESEAIYHTFFKWKGASTAIIEDNLKWQKTKNVSDEVKEIVQQLRQTRTNLAGLYRQTHKMENEKWEMRRDSIMAYRDQLERILSTDLKADSLYNLPTFSLTEFTFSDFLDALKDNEAFIDFYAYEYWDGISDESEQRYVAIVVQQNKSFQPINLGNAQVLDEAILAWREAVQQGAIATEERQELELLLWKPIQQHLLPEINTLWISPDKILARFPFNLLAKDYEVTIANGARNVMRLKKKPVPKNNQRGLLIGNLNFDAGTSDTIKANGYYEALTGTKQEIETIQKLLPKQQEIRSLTKNDATKTTVIEYMEQASWIHLATHGFFYQDTQVFGNNTRSERLTGGITTNAVSRNPLLESGLALSGANVIDPETGVSEGLLTAEEMLGIDLTQANLVVLSACDTGRGTEVSGQGVMGLQTAIMSAGASSLLMSLWKVPDEPTALLMQAFYENVFLHKENKADALQKAQETVKQKYPAPINWGAWVLVGTIE